MLLRVCRRQGVRSRHLTRLLLERATPSKEKKPMRNRSNAYATITVAALALMMFGSPVARADEPDPANLSGPDFAEHFCEAYHVGCVWDVGSVGAEPPTVVAPALPDDVAAELENPTGDVELSPPSIDDAMEAIDASEEPEATPADDVEDEEVAAEEDAGTALPVADERGSGTSVAPGTMETVETADASETVSEPTVASADEGLTDGRGDGLGDSLPVAAPVTETKTDSALMYAALGAGGMALLAALLAGSFALGRRRR
jgi:hypothetical protein